MYWCALFFARFRFLATELLSIIYAVRGEQVMLDSDLAKLYGVETRTLNQAVTRNPDRFPLLQTHKKMRW